MKCSYKKISALILALMMLLSVTGCTDNSASSLPGEKPSVYPFVNTLKEPDDNAMQAVEAPELTEQVKQKAEKVNREIVGWLQVPGTDINQPVVQATNNSKYLRLNYEGKYSFQGCYWVDYECKVGTRETQSRNTIIYGHNTAVSQDDPNGLDFAQLLRFTDEEFAASHPYIFFSTGEEDMVWEIFAVMYTYIPNCKLKFSHQIPGAVFSATTWNIFSWGFSMYIQQFNGFDMYGSLTTIVIVMLWLYFCFYLFLIGAHINRFLTPFRRILEKERR